MLIYGVSASVDQSEREKKPYLLLIPSAKSHKVFTQDLCLYIVSETCVVFRDSQICRIYQYICTSYGINWICFTLKSAQFTVDSIILTDSMHDTRALTNFSQYWDRNFMLTVRNFCLCRFLLSTVTDS